MIKIINKERELTIEESGSVTSIHTNFGTNETIYYQGDEPLVAPVEVVMSLNWKGLRISLFNSPLFQRAIIEANANAYSTLLKVITDGENDEASEEIFLLVLNMLGMAFNETEKTELNGYFIAHNFTIRL